MQYEHKYRALATAQWAVPNQITVRTPEHVVLQEVELYIIIMICIFELSLLGSVRVAGIEWRRLIRMEQNQTNKQTVTTVLLVKKYEL